jgi:pyruvate,water dikinase
MNKLLSVIKRLIQRRKAPENLGVQSLFRFKYTNFKELLQSNTELGKLIAEIEEMLNGNHVFGMAYVRSRTAMATSHGLRMVRALNAISRDNYLNLYIKLEEIQKKIKEDLEQMDKKIPEVMTLPYAQINKEMADLVGGKNANLGEALNRANVPVPEGFAITTYAFKVFMEANDLVDLIQKRKLELEPSGPKEAQELSEDIQAMILRAKVPDTLEKAILREFEEMELRFKHTRPFSVAMRSSAVGEDSELSFAGQYVSILNVTKDMALNAYKMIIASLYTPRAIAYRFNLGLRDEDVAMSVACIRMINSRSSGVAYTIDPSNPRVNHLVINSVWGLGPYAVDGTITPDKFHVSREHPHRIIYKSISHKPLRLTMAERGSLKDEEVPQDMRDLPSVSQSELEIIAQYAMALERHFGHPQDIEWAVDEDGKVYILQSRPLRISADAHVPTRAGKDFSAEVILFGGESVFRGVGYGPAYQVNTEDDLACFPKGGVLIAKQSSPEYAVVLPLASAAVIEKGSVTGHFASLAREFRVPCIINLEAATKAIPNGMDITVDSTALKVYRGKIEELLSLAEDKKGIMFNTPVYETLKKVSRHIIPLNLIDPKSYNFSPHGIKTIHDLMRFVHEKSYEEMFKLSDNVSQVGEYAYKLKAQLPIDLHIIDIGNGLVTQNISKSKVFMQDIRCEPLKELLLGMNEERERLQGPRPVNFKGFLSVLTEQALSPPNLNVERFGDKSYAIISDKYMNFSSRVGYHYSILDTYCGDTLAKNYITFCFMGGAADELRRNRRARAIGLILKEMGFQVDIVKDNVQARILKYPKDELLTKLRQIGRLLEYTRQMDMLMESEESVTAYAKVFFKEYPSP